MHAMVSQFQLLHHALEFSNQNHRVISQNLANVNTPNYRARQLSFEQFLADVQKHNLTGAARQFDVQLAEGFIARGDGNNVDLDAEIANLKRNDLIHQTLIQLLGAKMETTRTAIKG